MPLLPCYVVMLGDGSMLRSLLLLTLHLYGLSRMDICASCGHKVPVHNMVLHELNCRGPGTKPSKKRPRAESGGAGGSTARPINAQRSSAVARKDKEGAKTSAVGQGKGKQSKEEATSPDEKKEARRRKAEERRKAEINDLRSKIMESRCEGKHASRYEVSVEALVKNTMLAPAVSNMCVIKRNGDKMVPSPHHLCLYQLSTRPPRKHAESMVSGRRLVPRRTPSQCRRRSGLGLRDSIV